MAKSSDKIFRKAALDRMSSPERLDEMMHVTSGRGWLALIALIVLAIGALIWGVFGSVPTTVSGAGLIIRKGGLYPVPSLATGVVETLNPNVGDRVTKGETVGMVSPIAGGPPVPIKSPYTGQVIELGVDPGNVVQAGMPVLSLEKHTEPLEAVLFLPAFLAKQVRVGMTTQVVPSTVSKQNYGYMEGKVSWVAPFPASSQAMQRLLASDTLVQVMSQASGGVPLEVDVTLTRDPRTPTHFKWSSGKGPNFPITTGVLTSNQIVISQQRPLSLALPIF